MTTAPRWIAAPMLVALALSGCATFGSTPQQQSARTAWDRCPKTANLALTSIDPNGFVRYRAMSSAAGARDLAECLSATGVSSSVVVAAAP
jgi:hypothetical protein